GGLVECVRSWPYALFYILAELWGSVVLSLLFWSFANEITKVSEAKRFYSLFGLGANLALMVSGPYIVACTSLRKTAGNWGVDPERLSINLLMGAVVLMGIGIIVIYRYINLNVLTDKRFYDPEAEDQSAKKGKKKKPKMSLGESVGFLLKSKYLGCLCILVMAYGVAINLVEVTWKHHLKLQYPDIIEYTKFMGMFSTVTGIVTVIMMLFVGGNAVRRGWGFAAMITPAVLMITSTGFFSFVLFQDALSGLVAVFHSTPLFLAVLFGAAQNIMSKSSKYSLFDPTKEMAYIPLDQESKVKGKAAIDVVGARLGKSGGSLIQQGLIVTLGSVGAMAPWVAVMVIIIVAGWMVAVRSLNKQFLALTAEREAERDQAASVAAVASAEAAKPAAAAS
ncbi:MAG: NTP/NDP exchange transporter, partial [Chlamydiia bacterium]|nr:NTP/NDP exchange transporter [Chlamydiia bacterium]